MKELGEIIRIEKGAHATFQDGNCAMELVAFMAGEKHSDHPVCASPTIASFVRPFNDRLSDEKRQQLAPYLIRLVGSRGTNEQEAARLTMLRQWLYGYAAPLALRAIGLDAQAARLEAVKPDDAAYAAAAAAYAAADAAYAAAYAAYAAAYAAYDAAYAAAAAYAAYAAADAAARAIVWRSLRCLALRTVTGPKSRKQATADAHAAMAPLVDALDASAWDLLDRLIKVTENAPVACAIPEKVEKLRELGVRV